MSKHIPRFYLRDEQEAEEEVILQISVDQMHHAARVLRLKVEDEVWIFNEYIGEWSCKINDVKKCLVKCIKQIRSARAEKPKKLFTIAFSLINPSRMSFLIEKITELGVNEIIPVISQYTQKKRFNRKKAEQVAIEACEQTGRVKPPKLCEVMTLEAFLLDFVKEVESNGGSRKLFVADEICRDCSTTTPFLAVKDPAFLVGPEGGFSDAERDLFDKYSNHIQRISLGPNILRSETAAIAISSILLSF